MYEHFGYYCKGKKEQRGVIRTNCLDCLDRTNSFQSIVGWKVFLMQMAEFERVFACALEDSSISAQFKSLWADNGNELSIQYSGAGSTTAAFTKGGNEGVLGMLQQGLTSLTRFFNSNFGDYWKQKCIETFLNREPMIAENSIVNYKIRHFHQCSKCEAFANKAAYRLMERGSLNSGSRLRPFPLVFPTRHLSVQLFRTRSDLVVIGLQQFAPLSMKPVAGGSGDQRVMAWDGIILGCLNKISVNVRYVKVKGKAFKELYICVFAKDTVKLPIQDVKFEYIVTSKSKSKITGGLIFSFNIHETPYTFTNCHLSGSPQKLFDDIRTLYYSHGSPCADRVHFLFGDLGFGLQLSRGRALGFAKAGRFEEMFAYDELRGEYEKYKYLPEFREGDVRFAPNCVDGEVLGWRDRILWLENDWIHCKQYSSAPEITFSSHSPIYGVYLVPVQTASLNHMQMPEDTKCIEEVKADHNNDSYDFINLNDISRTEEPCSDESLNSSFVVIEKKPCVRK
eukprot:TRINITY_DN1988_c0_g1_i12.p1 TRINITY_DN1988_c0_g1~~TRINITY_DN1988_c0_g1_i12.p1  ORF type:complete len:509 (+),score=75.74 TRINITY_DN1988_c0_g1_i12:1323-2849(+)